jgi:choline dehydrogenase-like flavoprotein
VRAGTHLFTEWLTPVGHRDGRSRAVHGRPRALATRQGYNAGQIPRRLLEPDERGRRDGRWAVRHCARRRGARLRTRPGRLTGGAAGPGHRQRGSARLGLPPRRPACRPPPPTPRARVVGGSSTINARAWLRGSTADYDGWAALGNPGWGFADLLPYVRRAEADPLGGPLHGTDGPVPTARAAVGFLAKPIDADVLLATVAVALADTRRLSESPRA